MWHCWSVAPTKRRGACSNAGLYTQAITHKHNNTHNIHMAKSNYAHTGQHKLRGRAGREHVALLDCCTYKQEGSMR